MKKLIKPSCKACTDLIKAIDAYIAKADDDLEEKLTEAGFVNAEQSLKDAAALEETLTGILEGQTDDIADLIKDANTLEGAKKLVQQFFQDDATRDALVKAFQDYFKSQILTLADEYIKESDGQLAVTTLRQRTTSWINTWSNQLSNLMQTTTQDDIGGKIQAAIDAGESVEQLRLTLQDAGIRTEAYRARTASLTEMLRAHSVSRHEGIVQSPSVDQHKWRHSGTAKIKPRENHQAIDGQIKPKDEPFELTGADGGTYYPMYPRDPSLPPGESINCHCTEQPIVNKDVLGMSLEERRQLQQQIIDEDDGEWEKELDRQNRARSGLTDED